MEQLESLLSQTAKSAPKLGFVNETLSEQMSFEPIGCACAEKSDTTDLDFCNTKKGSIAV